MFRLLLILAALAWTLQAGAAERPAKELFGDEALPADLASQPVGFYSRGCMAGAVQLPPDGPYWQAMRLSRNRQWGMPVLVDFIETLGRDAAANDGWPGLLIGDMAQPRGGPMVSGHASHQTGLDVDIWLMPMPNRRLSERDREDTAAPAVVEPGPHDVFEDKWKPAIGRLIRRAALDPRVERIFVAPGIKKKLCETMDHKGAWLRQVRPYYGHHDHFHVRLSCPAGTPCKAQAATPPGDGCGSDLDWWFTGEPYKTAPPPKHPPKQVMMSDLPPACRTVLDAGARPGAMTMREAFAGGTGGRAAAPPAAATAAAAVLPAAESVQSPRLPKPRPTVVVPGLQ